MNIDFDYFKKTFQNKEVKEFKNKLSESPIVSVLVVTYQHVNYIEQCLDGILMQQTTFPFEILLGEDASTDGTREICLEYAQKYPDKIRLFLHHRENNIKINGTPTGRFNFLYNFYSAKGKYIALCEGDDYWTDPLKLQKQVDFLEGNTSYSYCGHNTFNQRDRQLVPNKRKSKIIDFKIIIKSNLLNTASLVFRKSAIQKIPRFFCDLSAGDWALQLIAIKYGPGYILPDFMSVYRIHSLGIWNQLNPTEQGKLGVATLTSMKRIYTKRKERILINNAIYQRKIDFGVVKNDFFSKLKFYINLR